MTDATELAAALMRWSNGSLQNEAAVRILIDPDSLENGGPSMRGPCRVGGGPQHPSERERRILPAVLSVAQAPLADLGDIIIGVDGETATAILDALAELNKTAVRS